MRFGDLRSRSRLRLRLRLRLSYRYRWVEFASRIGVVPEDQDINVDEAMSD